MKVSSFLVESNESIISRKGAELVLMVEGIAADMQALSNDVVTKPFNQFKRDQMKVFVAKLKGWALSALHELRPDISYHNPEKSYIDTLNKIINKPQETAEQIFAAVISRQINNGTTQTSYKSPMAAANDTKVSKKMDDILSSITF